MSKFPLPGTTLITTDDVGLLAWFVDMEFVDIAVPDPERYVLVFDTHELDAFDVLTARLSHPHSDN